MELRCAWVTKDPEYIEYHDKQWGRPVYDSRELFAKLCLDGQQAGLSWITILKRTESYHRAYLALQAQGIDFADFLWGFVGGAPMVNQRQGNGDIPATSKESDAMSKALKMLGFNFVGSTICYAFMQAVGMVNDHLVSCPCHAECLQPA